MGLINHTANAVNLAKAQLMSLDRSKLETPVQTGTLELMLKALIELGEDTQGAGMKTADAREKFILTKGAAVKSAMDARDK